MKHTLERLVAETISSHQLMSEGERVLVALSGGADSVALLCVLYRLGYKVTALHCNFHLRGEESNRDEHFVRNLCARLQVELKVKEFDTKTFAKEQKISIEMAARDLRYAWFEEIRQQLNANVICVAHHQKDQAETLLLNLLRGSGLRGIAGMHYKNGHIVRPMLNVPKADIETYLHECKQEWVNDSTNLERNALRNRLRMDVLPLLEQLNPKAIANIAKTADLVQQALPLFEKGLELCNSNKESAEKETKPTNGEAISKKAKRTTFQVDLPIQLHEMIQGCGFTTSQEKNIWKSHTGAIIESSTHRLLKDRDTFVLQSKDEAQTEIPVLEMKVLQKEQLKYMQPDCAYFDNALIQYPLHCRLVKEGDYFIPFGMKGRKLVSDLLTDLKLNRFEKEQQYVLCDSEDAILWVIGRRTSGTYKVTERTSKILEVQLKKES